MGPRLTTYRTFPSRTLSSVPVTVTVWAMFQFVGVNTSWVTWTVPSVRSRDVTEITTSAVGGCVRTTLNEALLPFSLVDRPLVWLTNTPGRSSFRITPWAELVVISAPCEGLIRLT